MSKGRHIHKGKPDPAKPRGYVVPHGPDDPCTCDGCWACAGHVVACTCDIDWNALYESKWSGS
jgi:hypothetical protein